MCLRVPELVVEGHDPKSAEHAIHNPEQNRYPYEGIIFSVENRNMSNPSQ